MSALSGRHAFVTGASRGIGAAIVRALSGQGASVTLLVRDASKAASVTAELAGKHCTVVADVTDRQAVHNAISQSVRELGPVDILVNNAGYTESAPFHRTSVDLFERMFAVHVLGAVHTTQAVLPGMIERGRGHVVNVASIAGLRGESYVSAYVAAKHALVGLTRALDREVARRGVAVNAVCPGYADTDLVHDSVTRISEMTGRDSTEALKTILEGAGQQRLITTAEVADAVVRLSNISADQSGQAVVIDGSSA